MEVHVQNIFGCSSTQIDKTLSDNQIKKCIQTTGVCIHW